MFFPHALPPDPDILIVEKGEYRAHDVQVHDDWRVRENITQRNTSGTEKNWESYTTFGGNSNYWWGDTPRYHRDDFVLKSKFGVGRDWPFQYPELAPYYDRAEFLMEIAGGGSGHIIPRDETFPHPPHALSRSDIVLSGHSDLWVPLPTARSNGGTRPNCCANGVCGHCPIQAKFTILNGFDRLAHPNFSIIIPARNMERFLEDTLDSVHRQSSANFEVIRVDDGSTDRTRYILDEIAKRDERFLPVTGLAKGVSAARTVFEDHNPFEPQSPKPSPAIKAGIFPNSYMDCAMAGREGRPVNDKIVASIEGWINYHATHGKRMGRDYGLHMPDTYAWGRAWMRFGPGSNWLAGRLAMYYAARGEMPADMQDAAVEGMWFGLGCNPENVIFVQGLGHRMFADPLFTERFDTTTIPGQISFGVAGGKMDEWELRKTEGAIYPANQEDWPIYAQIFESRSIVVCAEHGMKSNAMEWLIGCAVATSI